jgi:hypothetical protein
MYRERAMRARGRRVFLRNGILLKMLLVLLSQKCHAFYVFYGRGVINIQQPHHRAGQAKCSQDSTHFGKAVPEASIFLDV